VTPLRRDATGLAISSPLRRPRVARITAVGLAVLLLFASLVICAAVGSLGAEATRVFFAALAVSTLLAVMPLAVLWFLDRRERESPWLFASAFLWGGLIATTLALPVNSTVLYFVAQWLEGNAALKEMLGPEAALMIGAPIAAPLVEETTKGLGLLLLFWLVRSEFDNVRDGLVYGALIGAGFNWFESALYVQQNFVEFGNAPLGFQLGMRYAWLGLAGHAMFSGIFGASLGFARATRIRWLAWIAPFAGFALAVIAHAWNNSLPLFVALVSARGGAAPPTEIAAPPDMGLLQAMASASLTNLFLFLPFVLLMIWIIRRSGHAERAVIREELADEVGRSITIAEYQAVLADRVYRTRRIDSSNRAASAALVNAQHELAFRKRRLRDRRLDPEADPRVAGRRLQIARLRQLISETAVG
jgi:RsiW-degrading membrane proteinase PrsW (M82 family)